MSERDQRLRELSKHVGCGDVDNFGQCEHCDAIREALAALAQREAEIADLMRTLAGLEREASRLEDDREYNAGLCRAREAEIAALRQLPEKWRERVPEAVEIASETERKALWVTAAGALERANVLRECADELEAALRAEGPAPPPEP